MFGVHTSFSMLEGKATVGDMAEALKKKGWNYFGLSDLDSLSGYINQTKSCSGLGMKQIFGVELLMTEQLEIGAEKNLQINKINRKQNKLQEHIDNLNSGNEEEEKFVINLFNAIKKISNDFETIVTEEESHKEIGNLKTALGLNDSEEIFSSLEIDAFFNERNRNIVIEEGKSSLDRNPIRNAFIKCYKSMIKKYEEKIKDINKDKEEELVESETRSKVQIYAKNWHGLTDLMNIYSDGHYKGNEDGIGRVTKEMILSKKGNLLVMFDGMYGPLQRLMSFGRFEEAKELLIEFKEAFGEDLYIQLQPHKHKSVQFSSQMIYKLAKEIGVKVLITSAPRYTNDVDFLARKHKLCKLHGEKMAGIDYIESNSKSVMDAPQVKTFRPYSKDELFELSKGIFRFMTDEEITDAINMNDRASEECEPLELRSGKRMPIYPTPEGITQEQYLTKICEESLEELIKKDPYVEKNKADYWETLREELEIINGLKFAGYFLITKEIADYCVKNEMFGAGRGSAAGSLVALLTGITSVIDPIREKQMFERFLSYGRAKGIMYGIYAKDKGLEGVDWMVSSKSLIGGEEGSGDLSYKYWSVYSFQELFKDEISKKLDVIEGLGLSIDDDKELIEQLDDELVLNHYKSYIDSFSEDKIHVISNEEERVYCQKNQEEFKEYIIVDLMESKPITGGKERLYREYLTLKEDQLNDLKMFFLMEKCGIKMYNKSNSFLAESIGITTNKETVEGMEFLMIGTYDYVDIDVDRPSFEEYDKVQEHLEKTFGKDKVAPIGTYLLFKPASGINLVLKNYGTIPEDIRKATKGKVFNAFENNELTENLVYKIDKAVVKALNDYYGTIFDKEVEFNEEQIGILYKSFSECSSYKHLKEILKEKLGVEFKEETGLNLMKLLKFNVLESKGKWTIHKDTMSKFMSEIAEDNKDERFVEELIALLESNHDIALVTYALFMDLSAMGQHAGGIVISDIPLRDYLPVGGKSKYELKTMWSESSTDKQLTYVGAIKFDVLKLASLNLCMSIADKAGIDVKDFYKLDIYNKDNFMNKVTPVIKEGLYSGIFQIGDNPSASKVADRILKDPFLDKEVPITFDDLAVMSACNRPGPMSFKTKDKKTGEEVNGAHELFYRLKTGLTKENYHGSMIAEDLLKETKGVVIYQEQGMKLSQMIGGYDETDANKFRKETLKIPQLKAQGNPKWRAFYNKHFNSIYEGAIQDKYFIEKNGKKFYGPQKRLDFVAKNSGIDVNTKKFYEKGMEPEAATELITDAMAMSEYTFNSAHCKSYAALTYYMLLLKHDFPTAFAAANLDKSGPTDALIAEMRKQGISIQPPNVNVSKGEMVSVEEEKAVYWGMGAVKGAGQSIYFLNDAVDVYGKFKSLAEISLFVPKRQFGKRAVEPFIQIGAFSTFSCYHKNRRALVEYYNGSIRKMTEFYENRKGHRIERYVSPKIFEVDLPKFPDSFDIFEDKKDYDVAWKEIRLFIEEGMTGDKEELKKTIFKKLNKKVEFNDELINSLIEGVARFYNLLEIAREQEKDLLKKLSKEVEDYGNSEIREIEYELTGYSFTEKIYTKNQQAMIDFYNKKLEEDKNGDGEFYLCGEITYFSTRKDKRGNDMAFITLKELNTGENYRLLCFSSNYAFIKDKIKTGSLILFNPQELDGGSLSLTKNITCEDDFIGTTEGGTEKQEAILENFEVTEGIVEERHLRRLNMKRRNLKRFGKMEYAFGIINSKVIKRERKSQETWIEAEINFMKQKEDGTFEEADSSIFYITGNLYKQNRARIKEGRKIVFAFERSFNYTTRQNILMIEDLDVYSS